MVKLNRYLWRTVVAAVSMVLLVLISLDVIGTLIDELTRLRGGYTLVEAFIYTGLTLPRRIYEYLPFACLIGCLVGLGILANSSELVVIRSAGVSVGRIIWMVIKPVMLFIGLGLVLSEVVTPYTDQLAESRRAIAQGDTRSLQAQQGVWNREGDEFMYFNAVEPNGNLHGVIRYRFDGERQLEMASYAERATYRDGHWVEEAVAATYLDDPEQVRSEHHPQRRWESALTPTLLNILALPPDALSIRNLSYYVNYLDAQNLDSGEYSLALWRKVLQPLAIISLVLIAISFIFGPLRSVTMGQRIFTGVVFGIVFQITQRLLGPSSLVFGFPPMLAVLLPILVCGLIGVLMLRRAG